jgi:hypothetical protein
MNGMKVYLYCLCWNDARMLPFFFMHFDQFVDKYFIYDNGSTDDSLKMLKEHGDVEIVHFDVEGDSFVDEERRLGDTMWQGSDADWVIVTDIDELAYRPDMLGYLQSCREKGVTAIQTIGYEMVSDDFPAQDRPLTDTVTLGVRSTGRDRLCIFDPKKITETNYSPGRHEADPKGLVVWPEYPEVLLLHFKQLGPKYAIARSAELKKGLKPGDIKNGWGFHYRWSAAKIRKIWKQLKEESLPVPGLGTLKHLDPAQYGEQERVVRFSGLVDERWYLKKYPDIEDGNVDPLMHFCVHGWREGRKPNFYFDARWFRAKYPHLSTEGSNPLFDFITKGERENAWPSSHFNTPWYRTEHNLSPGESPLRHYLLHRRSTPLSPNPAFRAADYCLKHPEVLSAENDPYEVYTAERS